MAGSFFCQNSKPKTFSKKIQRFRQNAKRTQYILIRHRREHGSSEDAEGEPFLLGNMTQKAPAGVTRKKTGLVETKRKQNQNNQPKVGVPDGTVGSCEYPTPRWLAKFLVTLFRLNLDVCANASNSACLRYFTAERDGLVQKWLGRLWMNPPYGTIEVWMRKAYESVTFGKAEIAVCLVPVRTGSKWWQRWVSQRENCEVIWLDGRIRFGGAKGSAAFDSAVVVIRKPGHPSLDVRSLARMLKELRDENQLKAKQKTPNKLKIAA